jgi:hypothetical protein
MKKFFFFSVLSTLSILSQGQSIVKSTNLWSNIIVLETTQKLRTEKIRFTADTTINFLSYKVVERSIDSNQLNWSRYGFIREDADKGVFYKLSASAPEKLICDQNLAMDDSIIAFGVHTFNNTLYLDSAMYYVTAIDSTMIGSTPRRRLHLSVNVGGPLMEAEQWVDSMGSMSGILHNFNMKVGDDSYGLLCFEENSVLKYQNPYYTRCYVTTGIESFRNPDVTISVFPNPVMDISKVRIGGLKEKSGIRVRFYNSLGENVMTKITANEFLLKKGELTSGVYLITAESSGMIVASGKAVIL